MKRLFFVCCIVLAGCSLPFVESPQSDPELMAQINMPAIDAAWTDEELGVTVRTVKQLDREAATDLCTEVMVALDSFGPIWVIYGPGEQDRLSCIA